MYVSINSINDLNPLIALSIVGSFWQDAKSIPQCEFGPSKVKNEQDS